MRLLEIETNFDPLLIEFWKTHHTNLNHYFDRGGCGAASADLIQWLEDQKGIQTAELARTGIIKGDKKLKGWFRADVPDLAIDSFTNQELAAMKKQGLNSNKKSDRILFVKNNNLEDEMKWIPHSWVELQGKILDPSGFYIDGKSGQFDKMVKNKLAVADRYNWFS